MPGVFPDYLAPIVRTAPDGVRELTLARWCMPEHHSLAAHRSPIFAIPRVLANQPRLLRLGQEVSHAARGHHPAAGMFPFRPLCDPEYQPQDARRLFGRTEPQRIRQT